MRGSILLLHVDDGGGAHRERRSGVGSGKSRLYEYSPDLRSLEPGPWF